MKSTRRKVFIIGLGNILRKDEGFGVHFARYLKTKKWAKNMEIIDAGTSVFDILHLLNPEHFFIFVDAIKTDSPAGAIFRFDKNSIGSLDKHEFYSIHQIGLLELLNACKLLNKNINFTIIAVVPKSIEYGMELTLLLKKRLPKVEKLLYNLVQ